MQRPLGRLVAIVMTAFLVLTSAPLLMAAEIWTDLWIYQDGDTVTVTGVDFGANETVDLVTTDPVGTVVDTGTAETDSAGGFTYQFVLSVTVEGLYVVTATGQASGISAWTEFDPATVTYSDLGNSVVWKKSGNSITFAGTFTCTNPTPPPSVVRCTSVTSITIEIYQSNGGNGVHTDSSYRVASFAPTTPATFPVAGANTGAAWNVTTVVGSGGLALADGEYEVRIKMAYLDNNSNPQVATDATNGNAGGAEFAVDNLAPSTTVDAPSISSTGITVGGTISDAGVGGEQIDVELRRGTCSETGTFVASGSDTTFGGGNWSVGLSGGGFADTPGAYCVRTVAKDKLGNVQSDPVTVQYVVDAAPSVQSTNPANGATNVPVGSAISVTFDEDVTLDANAITVECPTGTGIAGAITGTGATHTFTPSAALPQNTTCTVTVHFNKVHDVDTNDPPDTMANPNYLFSFTTASANTPPIVDAGGPYSGDEGEAIAISGTVTDADSDTLTYLWSISTTDIDAGGDCVIDDATALDTTVTCTDDSDDATDMEFVLTLTVSGDPAGDVSDEATLQVANVDPMTANESFTVNPYTGTVSASFDYSDAGTNDTHTGQFYWTDANGDEIRTVLGVEDSDAADGAGTMTDAITLAPGCYTINLAATVTDDDGGVSDELTIAEDVQVDVYSVQFLSPIRADERNFAKYGNVLPVKVRVTSSCTGLAVTSTPLYLSYVKIQDDGTYDAGGATVAETVSSADGSGGQMRVADGFHIYNFTTKPLLCLKDYALIVRVGTPMTGDVIKVAILQLKK